MINDYLNLAKPRMVLMNVLVAAAAFVFGSTPLTTSASPSTINWQAFGFMTVGLAGVVAAACVFNNYADRALDAKMERTKNRGLASGAVEPGHALIFGAALLALGVILLAFTHVLSLGFALLGFVTYVFVYTPLKPITPY